MRAVPIEVLLPTRRLDNFTSLAVTSLLKQVGIRIHVLVLVDSCLAGALPQWTADKRVSLVDVRGSGSLSASLNRGLAFAKGEYVARMDADDVAFPDRLSLQAEFLASNPDVGVLGTSAVIVDSTGREIGVRDLPTSDYEIRRRLLKRNALIHPSVMFRREIVVSAGGYDRTFITGQDYELWLRMAPYTRFANLGARLMKYRMHAAQHSRTGAPGFHQGQVLRNHRLALGQSIGHSRFRIELDNAAWFVWQHARRIGNR